MSPLSTPAATEAAELVGAAATQLAGLLPSPVPLVLAPFDASLAPQPDVAAVRVGFVGATSAELLVVADEGITAAVAAAGGISLADALRPALEAAAATLGAGVLETATAAPLADGLVADDVATAALVDPATGAPHAWFALRVRQAPGGAVPHQRGPQAAAPAGDQRLGMRLLHDVEMTLTAEIGRTRLPVRQVLDLVPGTVLELDRAAGAPADVMVNGRLVARGEVVVVDEDYGIRITEIVSENA